MDRIRNSHFGSLIEQIRKRKLLCAIGAFAIGTVLIVAVILAIEVPHQNAKNDNECQKRKYDNGQDSFVCVCTAQYCDVPEDIEDEELGADKMVYFISSRDKYRMDKFVVKSGKKNSNATEFEVRVDASSRFQRVIGFGTAFTDSAGLMLQKLSTEARIKMLEAYFHAEKGIRFTMVRVPVGFSTKIYSYVDKPHDFEMKTFALASEDHELKIPNLGLAKKLVGNNSLKLHFMVRSMVDEEQWPNAGSGPIKGQIDGGDDRYYRAFAHYFRRFFEEYAKNDLNFWAMTINNEPNWNISDFYQATFMDASMQRDFARHHLSRELRKSNTTRAILLLGNDDNNTYLESAAREIYNGGQDLFAGLAFHWYSYDSYEPVRKVSELYPDKFVISTEALQRIRSGKHHCWEIGHADGCLNEHGGPSWIGNAVDSPIIVNGSVNEFYKQPMFYFLAHFSRFVLPDSIRIKSKLFNAKGIEILPKDGFFLKHQGLLEHIAFRVPSKSSKSGTVNVLVLINGDAEHSKLIKVSEQSDQRNKEWSVEMPPDSVVTAIWQ